VGVLGLGALAATMGGEPLAVGVGGHVAAINGDVAAVRGKLGAHGGGHAVDAARQHVAVEPELGDSRRIRRGRGYP
jgi:hypothetical protein